MEVFAGNKRHHITRDVRGVFSLSRRPAKKRARDITGTLPDLVPIGHIMRRSMIRISIRFSFPS
jgi:hypothetical protein